MTEIKELEKLVKDNNINEDKYFDTFTKYASYVGNGIYSILGLYAQDTRKLFLLYVLQKNNIQH